MTLISFKYNFIFVKTLKTAGTSIEVDLSQRLESRDIVTQILPVEPLHTPRNNLESKFYNHMSASEIKSLIGAETFESMFKFCVEREPVDKCISHFHMLRNSNIHNSNGNYKNSWDEYVHGERFPIDIVKYSSFYNGTRTLIVDKILRYDTLETSLPKLLKTQGIDHFRLKARAKGNYRNNQLITPDLVTPAQRLIIYKAFSETISLTKIDWSRPPDPWPLTILKLIKARMTS